MTQVPPSCPRCGQAVREPGLWSNAWQCEQHGEVRPYHPLPIAPEGMAKAARLSGVPVWVPHPMMTAWVVTGLGWCGDDRTGAGATVVCCSGPGPLGGPADLVLIAEEPGLGVGSRFAGIESSDPGDLSGPAAGKVHADGHPTPLWQVVDLTGKDDRVAFVGEASGIWLWAVLWPSSAGLMLLEDLQLADVRSAGPAAYEMLGYGAESPRMHPVRMAGVSE